MSSEATTNADNYAVSGDVDIKENYEYNEYADSEDDSDGDEADSATTYPDQKESPEFLRYLATLVPANPSSLKSLTSSKVLQKKKAMLSVENLPDGVRKIIEKFVGPRFATYIESPNWMRQFKSDWWTNYNQTYAYGRAYPRRVYVPRLENGGYKNKKPMYFHYPENGWKLHIHPSHDPDFVLKLKGCYHQLGLDRHLVVGQIIGMPDHLCRKLFE